MILSKEDYLYYLECDRIANNRPSIKNFKIYILAKLKIWLNIDTIWKFLICLRRYEYVSNCPPKLFPQLRKAIAYYNFQKLSKVNGFMILRNTCGPGLSLPHRGPIIINGGARIGSNCRIHVGVNIGTSKGKDCEAPHIGNNVYIAPGAKLFGPISIADKCVIGANAVVNKSCKIEGATLVGVPARIIANVLK